MEQKMEGSVEREIEYWKAYYQRRRTRLFASRSARLILGALVVPWLREGRDVSELAQALSETGVTAKGALDLATVIRSFTSTRLRMCCLERSSSSPQMNGANSPNANFVNWFVQQCEAAGKPLRKIGAAPI